LTAARGARWKRQDGTRRFRRAYIEAAKGIGKSPRQRP